jgi:hypothetical protein
MDHVHLSVPLDHRHVAKAHADAAPAAGAPRLTVEFLDKAGKRVGTRLRPPIPEPLHVEVPNGEAGFDWHAPDPHLSLGTKPIPHEAVALRAGTAARFFAEMPLSAATAAAPSPPAERRTFNPAGRWALLLVSEKFSDKDRFFGFVAQLDAYIRAQPPFSRQPVGDAIRLEALFWPSPAGGLFNTQQNGRLVYGDNDLVNRFVAESGATGQRTVVLVDLPIRGGAGGATGRPAWVTITSAANEAWEAVALHELGHSFGLADEYSNAEQPTPEPDPLEPNVTDRSDPAQAPWAALCTPGHPADPTCAGTVNPPAPLNVVGTFEGARYRATGRYRPTAGCLMRSTDQPFCPVCQAVIAEALT